MNSGILALVLAGASAQDAGPCNGRLSAWVASQNATGNVTINAVDSKRSKRPLRWTWGDGSTSEGVSPQRHRYRVGPARREFTVRIEGLDPSGGDCAEVTACFGTGQLKAWLETENRGSVRVNGVDPRQPTRTPFTWLWGDGTQTVGWFPQEHAYSGARGTITLVSAEDDGSSDCVQLAARVRPTTNSLRR